MYFEKEEEACSYSEVSVKKRHFIKIIPLTIGILILLLGILNMIIFFAIPIHKIKTNKQKLPNYSFKKPNIPIIVIHFILHTFIILIGLFLVFFSLENYDHIDPNRIETGLIILSVLTIFAWIIELSVNFSLSDDITSKTTVNDLISILTREPPVDFAFIYSKDDVKVIECYQDCEEEIKTCYSKQGVKIPVISYITSHVYNFSDVPGIFYFNIEQDIQLTLLFSSYFLNIMNDIKTCDPDSKKNVDYYPLIKGTYVVSMGKIPKSLTKTTRIVSIVFGVGVYYELYSKSLPLINFQQKIIIDANVSVNYDDIFSIDKCNEFGKCNINNPRPKP